jgi:hypothetical protein
VPMDWVAEARKCPFDDLPARFCGCPEGERIMDEGPTDGTQHHDPRP